MDRRSLIMTFAGGLAAVSTLGAATLPAAAAASGPDPLGSTADIRSALGSASGPTEMQWRRRYWRRPGWRRRYWRRPAWGWRRRYYWRRPGWRRCWINRWGQRVCRW